MILRIISPTDGISYPLAKEDRVGVVSGANDYGMHVVGFSPIRLSAYLAIYRAADVSLNGARLADETGFIPFLRNESELMPGRILYVCDTVGAAKERFVSDARSLSD